MVLEEPRRYAQIGEMPQTHMRRLQAQGCRLLTPMEDRQASDRGDARNMTQPYADGCAP